MMLPQTKINSLVKHKVLNERVLERNEVGPKEKYRRVLEENISIPSTNRSIQTNTHAVAT